MSLADRVRAAASALFGRALSAPTIATAQPRQTRDPRLSDTGLAGAASVKGKVLIHQRRPTKTLRDFSARNVWVRTAINRRRRKISQADWAIVRADDKKAKPKKNVVAAANELFTFVNDKGDSFEQFLGELVEDILVMDAGCAEIERTAGGGVAALWTIPGEEIVPNPAWNGSKPDEARYFRFREGKYVCDYLNSELVYMMATPRSCSPIGLSPLEVLIETVEADLYGESYEYKRLRETAPAGLLWLGGGVPPEKVDAYRDEWEMDIAGGREVAIMGGGSWDPATGTMSEPPSFIPFSRSAKDEQRREYMEWLATKIAAAFEMDLLEFNLSEAIHKSVGDSLQGKTDQGLIGLGAVIESYITREILWKIDPTHKHRFKFLSLTPRDAMQIAKVREINMRIGITTPNECRAEDGLDPVPWGDRPWPLETAKVEDPAAEDGDGAQGCGASGGKNDDDEDEDDDD